MSITVVNCIDQELVNRINEQAAARSAAAASSNETDFSAVLTENIKAQSSETAADNSSSSSGSYQTTAASTGSSTASSISSPQDYEAYFNEAANTYGVSVNILKAVAKAESNFNPSAVSKAGAVGIMQLMPSTAASLGVSNSYDARENIMGGAKYISQLLSRYQGNISLALAAYNAGSGNVDKYGGIPPFTETQNYVQKVLSYMNSSFETTPSSSSSSASGIFGLTGEARDKANEMIGNFLAENNITQSTLDMLVSLLKLKNFASSLLNTEGTSAADTASTAISNTNGSTTALSSSAASDTTVSLPASQMTEPVLPDGSSQTASAASAETIEQDFEAFHANLPKAAASRSDFENFPINMNTDETAES